MRKLIILLALGAFIACSSTRGSQSSTNNRETPSLYKIKRIKNKKTYYEIYATHNGSLFRIFSNSPSVSDCEKIKAGKSYVLNLKVLCPIDSIDGMAIAPNLGIKGFVVNNGKYVKLKKRSHKRIYNALNLHGLCIKD